jgi:hypothetical protein
MAVPLNIWTSGRLDVWTSGQLDGSSAVPRIDVWIDKHLDGWTAIWLFGLTYGWLDS